MGSRTCPESRQVASNTIVTPRLYGYLLHSVTSCASLVARVRESACVCGVVALFYLLPSPPSPLLYSPRPCPHLRKPADISRSAVVPYFARARRHTQTHHRTIPTQSCVGSSPTSRDRLGFLSVVQPPEYINDIPCRRAHSLRVNNIIHHHSKQAVTTYLHSLSTLYLARLLIIGPDGNSWGLDRNHAFGLNPLTRK